MAQHDSEAKVPEVKYDKTSKSFFLLLAQRIDLLLLFP